MQSSARTKRHVVLDHDDRVRLADVAQQRRRLLRLRVGHAGHGLVDQQDRRVLRQQHADFQPLLLAVGNLARQAVAMLAEAGDAQDLVDLLRRHLVAPAKQRGEGAARALQRQQDVVGERVHLEHGRLLELAADAEFRDGGFIELGQVVLAAVEQHVAFVGLRLAGDDVHHRRLAGAVGADDGAHFAGLDEQREIADGAVAVEADADAVEIENRGGELVAHVLLRDLGAGAFFSSGRVRQRPAQSCAVPTMPLGRASVTKMKIAPSTKSQ